MQFNKKYFYGFLLFFALECFIAVFVHDKFIRPFFGDVLIVVLLYFLLRSFFSAKKLHVVLGVLMFSFIIEASQYYDVLSFLGLQDNKLARVVLGSTFDLLDLLAYTVGACLIVISEYIKNISSSHKN